MPRLLFLGGIPGAGKTTVARELEQRWSVIHVVASSLLEQRTGSEIYERRTITDTVESETNQELIVSAYRRFVMNLECDWILLDGHYIVPAMISLFPVKLQTFLELEVAQYAILICDPRHSLERLASRGTLPTWGGSIERLQAYQDAELKHAHCIAAMTDQSLMIVHDSDHAAEDLAVSLGW